MENFTQFIDQITVPKVAQICGISIRAVYKWRKSGSLPRTEYTGETNYAELLAGELNNKFTVNEILDLGRPKKAQN